MKKGVFDDDQYGVDAFAGALFCGDPAAATLLDRWPEERMMRITRENDFFETAFAVPQRTDCRLRWFTPGGEIDLRGHTALPPGGERIFLAGKAVLFSKAELFV